MALNPIPKINSNNDIIGETTITEARQNGWPRRVSRVRISNEKGEYLLQKRSLESNIYPGVWDCSGGHVDVEETYAEAGAREVLEELGVSVVVSELTEAVLFQDTFYVACSATLPSDTVLTLKKDEVANVKWVTKEGLSQLLTLHPDNFTPWLVDMWENLKNQPTDTL